ncbi:MAG TPA: c-type cytochrome [Methylomirabilota bacterium]|jgi:cytochrome c553|nr:c-type cytochrome [Methylomirabilota bacterium]
MRIALTLVFILAVAGAAGAGPLDAPGAAKALNCAACHGAGGQSPSDTMPILAGLWPEYFKKAIQDYAAGRRPSPEMEPYAKQVLELGLDDVAAYFASQQRAATKVKVNAAAVERGRAAAQQCAVCHGPEGKGDRAKLIPDITGQPPGYLRTQMLLFKEDRRSPGDERLKALKALMKTIPDETFADLAAYFSSQR